MIGTFGVVLISIGFLSAIASTISHWLADRNQDPKLTNIGKKSFYLMFASLLGAVVILMYLVINHQFQYQYVYNYSSRNLPLFYLISCFWAGQEGTFLLWGFFTCLYGVLVMRKSGTLQNMVMFFIGLVEVFLFAILLKRSPFALVPGGQIALDGVGLNPLLQDPWMVIHPPILFSGFSSLVVPFAFGLAALAKNEYGEWIRKVFPWAILSALTLGTGTILGGYWAYKVLGWGGYWGWDPVENSSFVPWMIALALVHGAIIQRSKGGLQRTNLAFAILGYLMVLYGSFLTRSGVLGDFSVHSFSSLGINGYLISFVVVFLLISIFLFAKRFKEIPGLNLTNHLFSKEIGLWSGMILLAASALVTLIGASSPLLSRIWGESSNVGIDYYATTNYPIGVLIPLLIGMVPFVMWKQHDPRTLMKKLMLPLSFTFISASLAVLFGIRDLKWVLMFTTAAFAFWANLLILIKMRDLSSLGSAMTHVGVGLMLIGIITSTFYGQTRRAALVKGEPNEVYGYQFNYQGMEPAIDGKTRMIINVSGNGSEFQAKPRLYFSELNQGWMKNPHIKRYLTEDMYISPVERMDQTQVQTADELNLGKGETKNFGPYAITFTGFVLNQHDMTSAEQLEVGANLEIKKGYAKYQLTPKIILSKSGAKQNQAVAIPESNDSIVLEDVNADQKIAKIRLISAGEEKVVDAPKKDILVVEISKKPMINILWFGTILVIGGQVIAFRKRYKESK